VRTASSVEDVARRAALDTTAVVVLNLARMADEQPYQEEKP
jgi:hypothetical protein